MPYQPAFNDLLTAALQDSLDGSVLFILTGGILLCFPRRITQWIVPSILAILLTGVIALLGYPFTSEFGLTGFLIFWIPTLIHCMFSIAQTIQSNQNHRGRPQPPLAFQLFFPGILLLGFTILAVTLLRSRLSGVPIDWPSIHTSGLLFILFYLMGEIAPWKWFSLRSPRKTAIVLIYIAAGLFLLRGSLWCYGLFHSALKERPGSFRLKGVTYGAQLADGWRFPHLNALIERYWYYPIHPGHADPSTIQVKNTGLLEDGLQKAESLRQSLLTEILPPISRAHLIAEAIVEFQAQAETSLEGQYSLRSFSLDSESLLDFMKGYKSEIDTREAFGSASGRWYGEKESGAIDLFWRPMEYRNPPKTVSGENPLSLRVVQYGWLGDGFGWNAIAVIPDLTDSSEVRETILRIVYRVKNQNPQEIIDAIPYLGLLIGYGQMIWISEEEIIFEEIKPNIHKIPEPANLTGFNYSIENNILINIGSAYRSTYCRKPTERSPSTPFDVTIEVSATSITPQ